MSRADGVLLGVLALLALVATPLALALAGSGTGSGVAILEGPEGSTTVELATDGVYAVRGAEGIVTVEVREGAVRVKDAECPDGTCVRTGWVSRPGAAITCLPNGVTVRVGGERDDALDATVR